MAQIDTNTLPASSSQPNRGSMFERYEEPVVRTGQIGILLVLAAVFFMPIFGFC